jgi:serine/threonine protein kinase/tetratricopeptide (TPR) repeat protein
MAPEAGQLIGSYELLTPLGSGGMGDVYRARDTRLGRLVAIKFVSRNLHGDAAAEARLDREAHLASSLNHPGIVTVLDVGRHEDRPYVVMELIDGHSLSAELIEGRIRTRDAVDIALQIADALAVAHDAGIVHRDLKPQNVMLTIDRRVKIVDFGLSKQALPSTTDATLTIQGEPLTADYAVLGSVGYMAPEQVLSQPADARSDQFALGAILYEMLSGRRAFRKETPFQTLSSILEDEPPSLAETRADLPLDLIAIVGRCLAKRPEQRYDSTRDLTRDLRDVSEQIVADSRSLPQGRRPGVSQRRWPLVASVIVSVLLLGAPLWPGGSSSTAQAPLATTSLRYIAVLPFANVTKDSGDQVFADGLTETLASSLTQLERFQRTLRVVPASEVRAGRIESVKDARQAFGVTLAINGSIQRLPSTMRLTLNLVDAAQLVQIGSRTIDIATGREVVTQDSVISAATALLALEIEPGAQKAMLAGGTAAPGAYELFVKGRGYLQRFDRGAENIDLAIDTLSRAVAADPQYALAHTALGEAYWRKYDATKQIAWTERAVQHCETALGIDSRLAPVHVTLAMIARGRGRYEEAVAVAQRAVELDPVSSEAYRELGRAQEALNRFADAEATYQKAVEARPDDWQAYSTLGSFFLARSRLPEAEAAYQKVIALTPDNTRGYNNLGVTYWRAHREDDAAASWERSIAIRVTYAATSNLGTYYFRRGRYSEAARAFERAVTLSPNDWRVWRNFAAALQQVPAESHRAAGAYRKTADLAEVDRKVNPRQPTLLAGLADAYSMLGLRAEAIEAAAAAERLGLSQDTDSMFTLAAAYEQLGNRALALAWLEKVLAGGYTVAQIENSPSFVQLRKDRRYSALVSKSLTH